MGEDFRKPSECNALNGITGIERLVMLFTDSASIRDVLLFPYLRPEA